MIRELKEENEKLRAKLKGGKLDKEDMVAMGASEGMSDEGTRFNTGRGIRLFLRLCQNFLERFHWLVGYTTAAVQPRQNTN